MLFIHVCTKVKSSNGWSEKAINVFVNIHIYKIIARNGLPCIYYLDQSYTNTSHGGPLAKIFLYMTSLHNDTGAYLR